jgi:hypothetical protein
MDQLTWGTIFFSFAIVFIVAFACYIITVAVTNDLRRTSDLATSTLRNTGRYDILARYGSLDADDDLLILRRGKRSGPMVQIRGVRCGWSMLWLTLHDGRVIGAPLARYPQLAVANWWQRRRWELRGDSGVVVWPELEFQVSARLLLGHDAS